MKNLLLIFATMLLLSSCSTPQQLAQKHLRKAIKLDPNVIKSIKTDTIVKGIAEGIVPVVTPEYNGDFDFDCDSIKNLLNQYQKNSLPNGGVLIGNDSNVNISVQKGKDGKFSLNYKVKPKTIYVPVKVPYEVKITVPGKQVNVEVPKKAYTYLWFWIMLSIILLESFLLLKKTSPIVYLTDKIRGSKTS